jgi:hypothetical protein
MGWELVSFSALGVVVDEFFVADIVSVEDTVGSRKILLDDGPRNWYISVGIL